MQNFLSDKDKLCEISRFYGLSLAEFASKINVKNVKIYDVTSQRVKFMSPELQKIIAMNCPEISPYWLITGEGTMLARSVAQHNVNGDNLSNSQKSSVPEEVVKTLTETNASQQRTIEQLVTKLVNN